MAGGETTRDVRARLTVETEGEPEAFKEAADQVLGLAEKASTAQGPVGELAKDLDQLADSAQHLGSAQQHLKNFAAAIAEFDRAESVEGQRAALDKAIAAWKALGEQVPESIRRASDSAEKFESVIAALEKKSKELAGPLEKSFSAAKTAVEEFGKASEQGLSSAKKEGEEARLALDRLKETIEQVKQSGQTLGSGQAAELEELQGRYEAAVEGVARAGKAQQDFRKDVNEATEAVGGQVQSVSDLEDLFSAFGPRLEGFVNRWSAAFTALSVASAGLRELEARIDSLTEAVGAGSDVIQGLDDPIPGATRMFAEQAEQLVNLDRRFQEVVDRLAGFSSETEEHINLQNILRSQGISPTNLTLEEMRQKYAAIAVEMRIVAAAQAALREQAFGQFIDPKQFDLGSQAMARLVDEIRKMGSVSPGAIDGIRQVLQAFIDDAYRAGREIPPEIQKAAQSLGIATTEAERAAQAQEAWATSMGVSRKALEEQTAALVEHLAKLTAANPQIELPDLAEMFGPQIQALLDSYARLGVEVPGHLQKIADSWGIVGTAQERQRGLIAEILGISKQSVVELQRQAQDMVAALSNIKIGGLSDEQFGKARAMLEELFAAHRAAGEQIPAELAKIGAAYLVYDTQASRSLANVADTAQTTSSTVATSTSAMAASVESASTKVQVSTEGGKIAITQLGEAASTTAAKVEGGRVTITGLGTAAEQAGRQSKGAAGDIAATGEAAGKAGAEASKGAAGVAAGVTDAAKAAEAVKTVGEEVATASGKVGESKENLNAAKEALAGLGKVIGDLSGKAASLNSLADSLGGIGTALERVRDGAAGFADPIVTELEKIRSKAAEANEELSKITGRAGQGESA